MKNFDDNRISVRLDIELKKWYDEQGGSKIVRMALIRFYEDETGEMYEGTGK